MKFNFKQAGIARYEIYDEHTNTVVAFEQSISKTLWLVNKLNSTILEELEAKHEHA